MSASEVVIYLIGALISAGLFGWLLKLYGTQREHAGKIEVLERSLASSRGDHDTVVRLETEFKHVCTRLDEQSGTLQRIESKLNEKSG